MFIPYLQIGAGAEAQIPPYVVYVAWPAILRVYILFGLLFVVALVTLVILLRRMKIFQAIKMGESYNGNRRRFLAVSERLSQESEYRNEKIPKRKTNGNRGGPDQGYRAPWSAAALARRPLMRLPGAPRRQRGIHRLR